MEHSRLEVRLGGANLGSQVTVAGAVGGRAQGALVDPATRQVLQTVIASRIARQIGLNPDTAVPANGVKLTGDTRIQTQQKKLGKLSRLWVDRATQQVTHILLTNHGTEQVVDCAYIDQWTPQFISLKEDSMKAGRLPAYRDDAAIAGDVAAAIEDALLDPRARRDVHARVEDGRVEYSGILENDAQNDALLAATLRVPGVRGVRSDVVVTERMADAVVTALDALQAKGDLGDDPAIEVLTEHQIVYLSGRVATDKARAAAERTALNVAGTRIVVNQLTVDKPTGAVRPDPASPQTQNR
jgi:osmotically-inducible protein OsmY